MTGKQFMTVLAMVMALTACGGDTYESLSEKLDKRMEKQVPMSAEDTARIGSLRERSAELQQAGKTDESLKSLEEALQIIDMAEDAELYRKSEG